MLPEVCMCIVRPIRKGLFGQSDGPLKSDCWANQKGLFNSKTKNDVYPFRQICSLFSFSLRDFRVMWPPQCGNNLMGEHLNTLTALT